MTPQDARTKAIEALVEQLKDPDVYIRSAAAKTILEHTAGR